MKITITIICALLLSFSAAAQFQTVSRAYEVALSDFRVPATPSSGVIFKQCADCEARAVRVTPGTIYQVNGRTVPLKEFRKLVFQVRDRASKAIIVKHHLASDTIESVSVSL